MLIIYCILIWYINQLIGRSRVKNLIVKIIISLFTFLVVNFSMNSITNAQNLGIVGKIYSKAEANQIYGNVTESISIKSEVLQNVLEKAGDYIMFSFKGGKLRIFNSKRVELYPNEGATVDSKEVLNLFSVSKVKELLTTQNYDNSSTLIELRGKVLTITSGFSTLEFSQACPPICF
jgi:hypothetical protein